VLWTGEEQGLFGSQDYVKKHADELPRISAVLVHDEGTNYISGLGVPAAMMDAMRTVCEPLAGLNAEVPFELTEVDGLPNFVGSDNDSFVQVGVPGFFWRQSGRVDYEHQHHTQYDTFDVAVPEYQEHSALIVALTAYGVANLPQLSTAPTCVRPSRAAWACSSTARRSPRSWTGAAPRRRASRPAT
jgi:Zn-dependent M28 family amino/carboxypeptidase